MSTESRLRGVLAGLLLFLAASGAFTWTQSRPALAIQFVELAHAAAGLIVIVLGIAYVAVHLAQTLAAPERAARKSTRKPILAVRALFGDEGERTVYLTYGATLPAARTAGARPAARDR